MEQGIRVGGEERGTGANSAEDERVIKCDLKAPENTLHPLPVLLARVVAEAAELSNGVSEVGTRSEHAPR